MALHLLGGMIGLVAFGLALLAALRLIAPHGSWPRENLLCWSIGLVGRIFVFVGFFGPLLVILVFGGPLLWVATLVVIAAALERAYRARQYTLLGLLAVCAQRRVPLAPAVEAFAEEQGGRMGRRIRRFAARLTDGWPLPTALRWSRGVVPPDAVPAVCVGYESGRLAESLHRSVTIRNADRPLWDALAAKLVYLVLVLSFAVLIITFMMLKIVPAFEKIFDDFEAELPSVTRWSILLTRSFGGPAILLEMLCAAMLVYAVLCYCGVRLPRLPGTNWLWRRRDSALVLEALSLAAEGSRPMTGAVATLADCFPAWDVRRRLDAALADMVDGRDWLESLRARRLVGRAELGVLRAAQRVGNLPWALAEVAGSCRRRHAYRAQLLLQILFPVVILAVGLVVMALVVGYFLPLVHLIERLTPAVL